MHTQKLILPFALCCIVQACADDDTIPDPQSAADSKEDAGARTIMDASPVPSLLDATAPAAPDAGVAITGPKAYVGLFGEGVIGVLDVSTRTMIKTIPVTAPDGLEITPDGKKVYVASMDTGSVKVIETTFDTLLRSIDVGAKPAGLAISHDGKTLVVAVGGANEAVLVDVATDSVARHVPVGLAHASCIDADDHYAFVGSQVTASPAVVRVDLTADLPPLSIPVDKAPRMLACESGRIYFTSVGLDAVEVLDVTTARLEPAIASGGSPHDVRASGGVELVVSQTAGDIEFIDRATDTITDKVKTGKLAHWIALRGQLAYVTNEGDDNVSVVDLGKRTVIDTISVGKAPRKMVLQP